MNSSKKTGRQLNSSNTGMSRRSFLESSTAAAVCVLMGCSKEINPSAPKNSNSDVDYTVTRFMMKKDYPRLEVKAPNYRFIWHGRWFGFRLCSTHQAKFDERISYVNFGSFQVGGIDLISTHNYVIPFKGSQEGLPAGPALLALPRNPNSQYPEFLIEYPNRMRFYLRFRTMVPHIQMIIEPLNGKSDDYYTASFAGAHIFSNTWQGKKAAAYFGSGLQTGLCIAGTTEDDLTIETVSDIPTINCRIPADRKSTWALTVLGEKNWPINDTHQQVLIPVQPAVESLAFNSIEVRQMDSWEKQKMAEHNWDPPRGTVQNRVAGIYITAPNWHHPISQDPGGQIEYVEKVFLDKVIDAHAFQAIGLSRDGIYERETEFDTNARWLKLVDRIHAAGLKAYMKPGDGELRRVVTSADTLNQWARDCFAVPPRQQVDVLRLCWEAVVHPWDTADLCLPELTKWLRKPKEINNLPWADVHDRIVTAVADCFSNIIDQVRQYSPGTTVDLECGDTAVFEKLLKRHENLGVMYMCYGQYPSVCNYMDLYACVAGKQLTTHRAVLETDCYYTYTYPGLNTLYLKPPQEMYPPADIENIAAKHRHMNRLAVQAAWAWGINVCFTKEKFEAICCAE